MFLFFGQLLLQGFVLLLFHLDVFRSILEIFQKLPVPVNLLIELFEEFVVLFVLALTIQLILLLSFDFLSDFVFVFDHLGLEELWLHGSGDFSCVLGGPHQVLLGCLGITLENQLIFLVDSYHVFPSVHKFFEAHSHQDRDAFLDIIDQSCLIQVFMFFQFGFFHAISLGIQLIQVSVFSNLDA